ncbi:MAG: type II toxin-antitoxin system RelE/ParE family toxin [Bryobacterales bacterium]|nr:type II toxin-antitoxin system RelE/ParE family toxin [Bryobacterales bacterium]
MGKTKVFKTKWFQRFARKEKIDDSALLGTVRRMENGQVDADLGGGVIKQRIARSGRGKSGGYRTIILFRQGQVAVFMYGFAKSERDNIEIHEEKHFKEAARYVLRLTEKQLALLVEKGDFLEVKQK